MINANPPVASASVSGARPVTADPNASPMILAHAVLVSEKLDQSMIQMLHQMSVGGFNPNLEELLRLQAQTEALSAETKVVDGSTPSYPAPWREVAGRMS